MARIVIDPVTRIEGHLRIGVEVEGNNVSDAWSSGTMFRGIEKSLRGRDPREAWIWAQRICGVRATVHALASVRAVEDALGIEVPENATHIRNIIEQAEQVEVEGSAPNYLNRAGQSTRFLQHADRQHADGIDETSHLLVLDAVDFGAAPGILKSFHGEAIARLPTSKSVHLLGLPDLINAMILMDEPSMEMVLLGIQQESTIGEPS